MRIFLAGCEKNLLPLLEPLAQGHHRLVVMDPDRQECVRMADLTGLTIVRGDPTSLDALLEARIRRFDLVVAVMENDAENLMVCDLAKRHFEVTHSLASVSRPYLEAVLQRLGVDEALSLPELAVHLASPAII